VMTKGLSGGTLSEEKKNATTPVPSVVGRMKRGKKGGGTMGKTHGKSSQKNDIFTRRRDSREALSTTTLRGEA